MWLIVATMVIGALALIDTRTEAIRTSQQVSDRVLVGSAMAISEGMTVDAAGGLAVNIPFSALDMLSSTAQDQVFYRIDGPDGFITGYDDLAQAGVAAGADIGLADDRFRDTAIRKATFVRVVTTGAGVLPVAVTVAESTLARDQLSASILQRSALRIAGLIAVAALAAWGATTLALRPLDRMSTRIAARAPQDLRPIEGPAPQELLPVLGALNGFLARLQNAMSALANFSSNANHQIRTPLTVARAQIGLAQKNAIAAPVAEALAKADAALVRTERVLEQLLLLARIESSSLRPEMLPCDVAAVARAIAEDELPRALQLGQDLGFDGPASAMVISEEVLLGELLRNLVSNALLHCPHGSVVTLQVTATAAGTKAMVIDTGPAVPQAMFDRLQHRLTAQVGDGQVRAGQHGLGLHIVREIAEAIGASVTLLRNTPGQGLRIEVALPSAP